MPVGLRMMARAPVAVLQTDVAEELSRPLVDQSKENSERDVEEQAAADEFGSAVFLAKFCSVRR